MGIQWTLYRHLKAESGNSLAAQWLGLCTSTTKAVGSIPGQGTKVPHVPTCRQKNFFNKYIKIKN